MFRILIEFFWPVLILILLYWLWYQWAKRKRKEGEDPLKWTDGPWVYVIMLVMVSMLLCFGFLIYSSTSQKGEHYTPAEYKDGTLVPSKIE